MKKIILIIICISLLVFGCTNKSNNNTINEKSETFDKVVENKNEYRDLNNTPIGIYQLNGNTLIKMHSFSDEFVPLKDIVSLQIFPSNEESISLNQSFGKSFYNEFIKYNTNNKIKIGFNIKFSLINGETINYNILSPDNTFDKWEYLMNYIYDDYINDGKSFYSHLEMSDYNENSLFTTFKMQSNSLITDINSKIEFSVFTYDGLDDFVNNEYRGNSIYTMYICNSYIDCN